YLSVAIIFCIPVFAQANDGVAGVAIGGIMMPGKSDKIKMRKEVLEISVNKIKVEYEFVNLTEEPVTLSVMFPLPEYSAAGVMERSYAGEPDGFHVLIDGKNQPFVTDIQAFDCGEDIAIRVQQQTCTNITSRLKKLGLSDRQIAHFPKNYTAFRFSDREEPEALSGEQKKELLASGLLEEDGLFSHAKWWVKVVYLWQVTFPVGRSLSVAHAYRPFSPSGSSAYLHAYKEEDLRTGFCADDRFVGQWKKLQAETADDLTDARTWMPAIDYILTTANSWATPIENFTLIIRKTTPSELVSLCFPGTVTKVDAKTLMINLHNFQPQQDLKAVFMRHSTWQENERYDQDNLLGNPPVIVPTKRH
uniref:DUF4424 family protein n=1 Tax=Candidatus Magnetaquicoccus inordinatus TaxID=2496818 RepID=UPI00102C48FC